MWGRPPPVSRAQRVSFLRGYDVKVNQKECVPPDLPFFTEMVNRPTDSAPGPDGIPFAAWRAAPDLAALLLHRVFEVITKGNSPPEGFNHGLLYLLPKKDTASAFSALSTRITGFLRRPSRGA